MTEQAEIKLVIRQFMETILFHRDIRIAMDTISDSIIGVGMGDQGTVANKQDLQKILENMNATASIPTQVNYPKEEIRYHPPSFATATIFYDVVSEMDGNTVKNRFIQTIAAKKEHTQWKICLLQAVPLTLTESCIDNYPLSFADTALAELKIDLQQNAFDLMNKNFSGGIWGTYMSENFPLYFANDIFMKSLGYTHDEFYAAYATDATKIIYKDDKERILTEVHHYLAENASEYTLKMRLNTKAGGFIWVIEDARRTESESGVPILLAVTTDVTEMMLLQEKLEAQNKMILSGIHYAAKIQHDLLPDASRFAQVFADYSLLWKPRDIVGGDIYWLKSFARGTVLCLCDCTGHGTPGALLTMLVSTTLDSIITAQNYTDTAQIMLELDQKMSAVLNVHSEEQERDKTITHIHDGCDLAILFIANNGTVTLSSAGIHLFICDGTEVQRLKGQRLHIGDGDLISKDTINVMKIPAMPSLKFYIASDGFYDQIGDQESRPFGYQAFKAIILQHHAQKQAVISETLWNAFENHRGQHGRQDDVSLISFKL